MLDPGSHQRSCPLRPYHLTADGDGDSVLSNVVADVEAAVAVPLAFYIVVNRILVRWKDDSLLLHELLGADHSSTCTTEVLTFHKFQRGIIKNCECNGKCAVRF